MSSKYQKIPFDETLLGRIQSIKVLTHDNQLVEIDWKDLKLVNWHSSLSLEYKSDDGDLYMPICRETTFKKVMK